MQLVSLLSRGQVCDRSCPWGKLKIEPIPEHIPFNEMIVHIKNAVNVNANGKIINKTMNRDALCIFGVNVHRERTTI